MTTQELISHGLGKTGIRRWVDEGRLYRRHRGVYSVGRETLSGHGRAYAAVRACGPRAVASHRAAAYLHDLLIGLPAVIDVTVPRTGAGVRPGIRPCASRALTHEDITDLEGVPCTTVARTLVDLGDRESRRRVEIAWERAELLRTFDRLSVAAVAARAGSRRGARIARALLHGTRVPGLTEGEIEELFLADVRPAKLKPPECQRWITLDDGGPAIRADFLWPAERLVVETDGGAAHMTRRAFEEDRRRDQRLAAAGYTVVRFTWRQLSDDPDNVRRVVRDLLARLAPQ